jgi:CRP-like cAMP-binding protein
MRLVQRSFALETFVDGDTLPHDPSDAPFVGLVRAGVLREDLRTRDGQRHLLALTFAGETLSPLLPRRTQRQLSAMGPTEVLTCGRDDFDRLAATIPRLRLNLLRLVQDQLAEAQRWQVLLGRMAAPERVAAMLAWFLDRQGAPDEKHLPLSRCELGQLTGLTLETVSRQMRALEKAGVIALPLPTRIRVLDACALNAMTGTAPARRAA